MNPSISIPPAASLIPNMTTVYIVRHADKAGGGSDPPLSPAGLERAQTLAYMLRQDKVKAVFVTSFLRSHQTGEPAALDSGVQRSGSSGRLDPGNTCRPTGAGCCTFKHRESSRGPPDRQPCRACG
jgi:hypothetical protein